jgi:structural maintenance of chromosome 4
MGAYEKQEVGLEEKRKHANGKAKKLKKSFQDVSLFDVLLFKYCIGSSAGVPQDENAPSDALRAIQENTAKMKSEKKKADDFEEDLQKEEKVLEGIRDGLKGTTRFGSSRQCAYSLFRQDASIS